MNLVCIIMINKLFHVDVEFLTIKSKRSHHAHLVFLANQLSVTIWRPKKAQHRGSPSCLKGFSEVQATTSLPSFRTALAGFQNGAWNDILATVPPDSLCFCGGENTFVFWMRSWLQFPRVYLTPIIFLHVPAHYF
jgi:hypothetical protein